MIKDRLEHASSYYGISENLKKGFEWLKNNDMQNIMDGKYVIDGDKLFANVQSYNTKEDAPFEGHRKYIDIQYMIKGVEKIGVVDYKNCSTIENYNEEKDIEFLKINVEIYAFIKILLIEVIYNVLLIIILYPLMKLTGYEIENEIKGDRILTRYF